MRAGRREDVEGKEVAEAGASGVTIRVLMGENVGATNFVTRHFEVDPGGRTPSKTPARASSPSCASSRRRRRA